mgnify:CR=1 FL=1
MQKVFLILALVTNCFAIETLVGIGCNYDPVIDNNVQVSTTIGLLKSFSLEKATSVSLEVQAPIFAVQKVNLNIPLIIYYDHFVFTGACNIFLDNVKQDIENEEIRRKFSVGAGLFYNYHNFNLRPTISYDITNKEFSAQLMIVRFIFGD